MFGIRASIAHTMFYQHLLFIWIHVQAVESKQVLSLFAIYC